MINVNKESVKLEGSAEVLLRANVEIVISVINLKKDNSND